jgi:hypothetical protein
MPSAKSKDRPVLLLVDFADADPDTYWVAITSTFPHPPPAGGRYHIQQ